MKYNEKADAYLESLYHSVGAMTWEHKYNTLCLKLDVLPENQSFHCTPTGEVSWEQKVGCMEYELLEREGLIELTYV